MKGHTVCMIETDVLGEPYVVHGARPDVGASVGTYLATAGESVTESLARADEAMYVAKRSRPADAVVITGR